MGFHRKLPFPDLKKNLGNRAVQAFASYDLTSFEQNLEYTYFVSLFLGKQNTVPCRPGYMCNTCEFVAGTAVHLRNHLETHNDQKTYACGDCNYTGKSKR